ncbi:M48 family metallopeptidase [Amphritea sp. 1_MG-2023]|uniref:M48 family metallopeptidase n=1 Tax=Amphritea sp. 1_MG-2023 TaxID=3062670 RepID=UPI0026E38913|nr:M48 family metallopeptidase [Amphritea sp. 1_MG-2023]MDO6563980.1 M48 family metallopeptidase [Amphritea sp. 1_MG-2023]
MNFYRAQDQARQRSRLLLLLFVLLNIGLVCLINLLFAWYLWVNDDPLLLADRVFLDYLSWQRIAVVALAIALLLLFASWLKWLDVKQGGGAVAQQLGGEQVLPLTTDAAERRLINVVEEMALAAGVPVPPVYVMQREMGINAFAAGLGLTDAAICVTRGTLDSLSRDQLQGVIAHEFSHILNGDMRLNMRLLVMLHGMVFFAELGRVFVSSRSSWWVDSTKSRRSNRGYLVLLGLGLMLIGWCGVMAGNMIKAAISRQREFLADASAVQFTRNPDGIAGALKVIGGSHVQGRVQHPECQEAGHLFFAAVMPSWLWSTHPPLDVRIRKVDPRWDGQYLEPQPSLKSAEQDVDGKIKANRPEAQVIEGLLGALAGAELMDYAAPDQHRQVAAEHHLYSLARDPYDARMILLGLLMDGDHALRQQQLNLIQAEDTALCSRLMACLDQFELLSRADYLPLIELTLPALKSQSANQYKAFKRLLLKVVQADRQIDLFEWVLYQLVSRYCDAHFGARRARENKHKQIASLADEYALVISMLAYHGETADDITLKAFNRGAGMVGLYTLKQVKPAACTREAFAAAVSTLATATPFLRQRMLKGMVQVVRHDGQILPIERELITAIAAVMESPLIGLDDA